MSKQDEAITAYKRAVEACADAEKNESQAEQAYTAAQNKLQAAQAAMIMARNAMLNVIESEP